MSEVAAEELIERASELLEAVEHKGESFTVTRNGHPIARIEPTKEPAKAPGNLKDIFRRQPADPKIAEEVRELQSLIAAEDQV
jgi:prevent-host-death family protein